MTEPHQPKTKPEIQEPLSPIVVNGSPAEIVEKLAAASRRGKLGGFQAGGGDGVLFVIRDFGGPFESTLHARGAAEGGATRLNFDVRMQPRLAWVYGALLAATVWPGVWLTDSMLRTYFTGYDYRTWMWYLPLTAPFVPWGLWTTIRKSKRNGRAEAGEIVEKIAAVLSKPGAGDAAGRAAVEQGAAS